MNTYARIDTGPFFPCRFHVGDWNGWALPIFGFDSAMLVAVECGLSYDAENDRFVETVDYGAGETETTYYPNDAKPGQPAEYSIGAWAWIWDSYTVEEMQNAAI